MDSPREQIEQEREKHGRMFSPCVACDHGCQQSKCPECESAEMQSAAERVVVAKDTEKARLKLQYERKAMICTQLERERDEAREKLGLKIDTLMLQRDRLVALLRDGLMRGCGAIWKNYVRAALKEIAP